MAKHKIVLKKWNKTMSTGKPLSALGRALAEQNEKTLAALKASKVKLHKPRHPANPFATDERARHDAAEYATSSQPHEIVWDSAAIQAATRAAKKPMTAEVIAALREQKALRKKIRANTNSTTPQSNLNQEGDTTMSTKKASKKTTSKKSASKKASNGNGEHAVRPGSKRAILIELLTKGATQAELEKKLSYDAASVRVAIYCLKRDKKLSVKEDGDKLHLA